MHSWLTHMLLASIIFVVNGYLCPLSTCAPLNYGCHENPTQYTAKHVWGYCAQNELFSALCTSNTNLDTRWKIHKRNDVEWTERCIFSYLLLLRVSCVVCLYIENFSAPTGLTFLQFLVLCHVSDTWPRWGGSPALASCCTT